MHDGVPRRQGGDDRAHRQDKRKVEGRDNSDDAVRHPPRIVLAPGVHGGEHDAVRLDGGSRGMADEAAAVLDLDLRLGPDGAGFANDPADELIAIVVQDVGRPVQYGGALGGRGRCPCQLRAPGLGRRPRDIDRAADADRGHQRVGRGIAHLGEAAGRLAPAAQKCLAGPPRLVDEALALLDVHSLILPCWHSELACCTRKASGPAASRARSTCFWILPEAVRGKASSGQKVLGTL